MTTEKYVIMSGAGAEIARFEVEERPDNLLDIYRAALATLNYDIIAAEDLEREDA